MIFNKLISQAFHLSPLGFWPVCDFRTKLFKPCHKTFLCDSSGGNEAELNRMAQQLVKRSAKDSCRNGSTLLPTHPPTKMHSCRLKRQFDVSWFDWSNVCLLSNIMKVDGNVFMVLTLPKKALNIRGKVCAELSLYIAGTCRLGTILSWGKNLIVSLEVSRWAH